MMLTIGVLEKLQEAALSRLPRLSSQSRCVLDHPTRLSMYIDESSHDSTAISTCRTVPSRPYSVASRLLVPRNDGSGGS
jgi:hypothetical protein